MGRPLAKRFFGNRNVGTTGTADNFIGGEGVGSYGTIVAGSGWTTIPTVTFSAPNIPGGVSVDGIAHYKALSFATTANGTGYDVGNVLEVVTGTAATKARAPVASITAVGVTLVNAGDHYNDGDILEFQTGQDTYVTIRVNTGVDTTDRPAESLTIVSGGTRSTAKPTGTLSYQNTLGGTGITFTLEWGAYSFGAPSVAGDYTVFPSTGASGTLTSITGTGTGAKADITMGLLSIAVTEKGSGYTTPADAAVSFSGSTSAAATAVLTVDSGRQGGGGNATTNQENAIIIRAKTTTGGTAQIGDIIKQQSTRRYKVKTGDGTAVCKLVATTSPAVNQGYILATDITGNEYYVTKITSRKCILSRKAGGSNYEFADPTTYPNGQVVKWTLGTQVLNSSVKIENA